MKKILSLVIALIMIMSLFNGVTMPVSAATVIKSGSCGQVHISDDTSYYSDDVRWSVDSDGVLLISGTGKIQNYSWLFSTPPWYEYSNFDTIIISDGVTRIGDFFFRTDNFIDRIIIIPESVTSIGEQSEYGDSSTCITDVYYAGTEEQWNKIQKDESYIFSGANIHFNQLSEYNYSYIPFSGTDSSGNLFSSKLNAFEYGTLNKTQVYASCSSGLLNVDKDAYEKINISDCQLKINPYTYISMVPKSIGSYISAVHCNGQDALINNIEVSHEEKTLKIYAYSSLLSSEIKEFQLMQDASVIQSSVTGIFNISPERVTLDKAFYVRVIKKDGTKCAKIKTNIKVTDKILSVDSDFKIGDKIEFEVPPDVPFIGSEKIALDFTVLPINVEKKGDSLRIGIGCSANALKDDISWNIYKNNIEKKSVDETFKEAQKLLDEAGMIKKFKAEAYGYAELSITDSGELNRVGGQVIINITGKASKEWQVSISIPVVVKFSIEGNVETELSVGFDFSKSELYFDGNVELILPKITVSGGLGIAYFADVSVYGSAENVINMNSKTDTITAAVRGEIGASVKALSFTYKKSFLKGESQYYHSGAGVKSANTFNNRRFMSNVQNLDNFSIDRSYIDTQTEWLDTATTFSLRNISDNADKTLQKSVYYSANPKMIITDNGTKMMIWTADIKEREIGNHTAVVYSVYNDWSGTWSEPAIIDDDQTADFYPEITTDGTDVYVTWMDSERSDFTEYSSLDEVLNSCEITVAKYSAADDEFLIYTLTHNDISDISPKITAVDNEILVAWIGNSENDILTFTGENIIYYSKLSNGVWSEIETYTIVDNPISGFNIGNVDDIAYIVYTLDADYDLMTIEDVELYAGEIGTIPISFTNNNIGELNPQFAKINGNDSLVWYADGNLCYTTDMECIETIDGKESGFSSNFAIAEQNGETTLLSVISKDDHSEINQHSFGDKIGLPIEITSTNAYVNSFSVGNFKDVLFIPYLKSVADIGTDYLEESADLCMLTIGEFSNISIENISVEQENVSHGAEIPVEITLKNNGNIAETSFEVVATLDNQVKLNTNVNVTIPSGETKTIFVNLKLEDIVEPMSEYVFTVTPITDAETTGDNGILTIGHTDLELQVDKLKTENIFGASVIIKNNSCVPTRATLNIRKHSSEGEIIADYYISEIKAYDEEILIIDPSVLPELKNSDETLCFEVVPVLKEFCTSNNNGFIYLNEDTEIASGTCGENLTWVLGLDGVLTIAGEGKMEDDSSWKGYKELIKSVVIENGVTTIRNSAFSNCSNLSSIEIPESVIWIGVAAFQNCNSLTEIEIPNSVTYISEGAFVTCKSLSTIKLPDNITSIERNTFALCNSLISIEMPESVTQIGVGAFQNCNSLTKIEIPDSVTSIGENAFRNCASLADVYYAGSESQWNEILINSGNDCLLNANIHFAVEETGVEVSGNVKAFCGDVMVELLSDGEVVDTKTVTKSYTFKGVEDGAYTVRVSASKHATREYEVTVAGKDVTQNVEIWLYGDVTKDGIVNNADTIQINRKNVNMSSVFDQATDSDYRFKVANITAITGTDIVINNVDVLQINRKISNMPSMFDRIA